jgi:hypothetical protein
MSGESLRADAGGTAQTACTDRRSAARHRCSLEATCHAIGGGPEGPWPATILELSTTGLGIILPQPLERGTILIVDLATPVAGAPESLSACVIHTRPHEEGGIFTGCILAEQFGEAELAALLG